MDSLLQYLEVAEKLAVVFGIAFGLYQIRAATQQRFMQTLDTAEADFNQLNQLMIEHEELRSLYRSTDAESQDLSDADLKTYVYLEMYYAHLARLYVLTRTPLASIQRNRKAKQYWLLYRNYLKELVTVELFQRVHASAKSMGTFETSFIREVDKVMKEILQ